MNDTQIIVISIMLLFVYAPFLIAQADASYFDSGTVIDSPLSEFSILTLTKPTCDGTSISYSGFAYKYEHIDNYGLFICDMTKASQSVISQAYQHSVYVEYYGTVSPYIKYYFTPHLFDGSSHDYFDLQSISVSGAEVTASYYFTPDYGVNKFYYYATFSVSTSNDFTFKHTFLEDFGTGYTGSSGHTTTWWHIDFDIHEDVSYTYAKRNSPVEKCYHEATGRPADWVNMQFWDSTWGTYSAWTTSSYITKHFPAGGNSPYTRWSVLKDNGGGLTYDDGDQTSHDNNDNDEHVDGSNLWGSWLTKAENMQDNEDYSALNYWYTNWS